jgi:hypothetical protein
MNPFALPSPIIDVNSPVFISLPVVFLVFKVLFLIAFSLYIIYALVIVRQIGLMDRSIKTTFSPFVKILGLLHLFAALAVWVMALIA